jgi:hypothetical protein
MGLTTEQASSDSKIMILNRKNYTSILPINLTWTSLRTAEDSQGAWMLVTWAEEEGAADMMGDLIVIGGPSSA